MNDSEIKPGRGWYPRFIVDIDAGWTEWTIPASARKKLLDIVGRECPAREKFLEEIEHVIRMAGFTQQQADNQLPKKVRARLKAAAQAAKKLLGELSWIGPHRQKPFREATRDDAQPMTVELAIEMTTELLLSLRAASNQSPKEEMSRLEAAAQAAEKLVKTLYEIDPRGQKLFREVAPSSMGDTRRLVAELSFSLQEASNRAKVGKGNTRKSYVDILAAGVAQALRNIGIEPRLWRPKVNKDGTETKNPYFECLEIACQCLGGIGTKDLYRVAEIGIDLKVSSPVDIPQPDQTKVQ